MVFPTQVRANQVSPYGTVSGMQDVSSLLTAIMPIIMIMMVFMMMTPMFKGMSKGFES
jgi:hypothetical protein